MNSTQPGHELQIDTLLLRKAALIYRAINHPLRQQMLRLLHRKEKITVTELYVALRIEQSVASQHLAILRQAGLVSTDRKAKNVFYTVNHQQLDHLQKITRDILNPQLN
jgi:DNA-binding transcriptional ArsR family regulator